MLGLVFVPTSKRCITFEQAQAISSAIRGLRASAVPPAQPESTNGTTQNEPWFALNARRVSQLASGAASAAHPLLVGVFQDQPLSYVLHCVAVAQLDMVQLHGSEPLEWSKQIPVPVIRAFHVDPEGRGTDGITRPGLNKHVLLDTAVSPGGLSGGKGKTFDWEFAKRVVLAGEGSGAKGEDEGEGKGEGKEDPATGHTSSASAMPIILAGGLTADNVAEAVGVVRPWAVDVSRGVETTDGTEKDEEKVKEFIGAVRGCTLPSS